MIKIKNLDELKTIIKMGSIDLSTLDVSWLKSLNSAFLNIKIKYDISKWDVSNVIDFTSCFHGASSENGVIDLSKWNTWKGEEFGYMFSEADFDEIIGIEKWKMGRAVNLNAMFLGNKKFNQNINNWNIKNVEYMDSVFYWAEKFNQPLDKWSTGKVVLMSYMFYEATKFNQNINDWDVGNVEDFNFMFAYTGNFNQPLNKWNMAKANTATGMFSHAIMFNQPLNDWNTIRITDMGNLFNGAIRFNQPLNLWNTKNVRKMDAMFKNAKSFNQNINDWDVSNVDYMVDTFSGAIEFNQPLDKWDVKNVRSVQSMFKEAFAFKQDLSSWELVSLDEEFNKDDFCFCSPMASAPDSYFPKYQSEYFYEILNREFSNLDVIENIEFLDADHKKITNMLTPTEWNTFQHHITNTFMNFVKSYAYIKTPDKTYSLSFEDGFQATPIIWFYEDEKGKRETFKHFKISHIFKFMKDIDKDNKQKMIFYYEEKNAKMLFVGRV